MGKKEIPVCKNCSCSITDIKYSYLYSHEQVDYYYCEHDEGTGSLSKMIKQKQTFYISLEEYVDEKFLEITGQYSEDDEIVYAIEYFEDEEDGELFCSECHDNLDNKDCDESYIFEVSETDHQLILKCGECKKNFKEILN